MSYILLPLPYNPYIKQGMLQKFVHRHPLEFGTQARGSEIITTHCFEVFRFHITAFVRAGSPLEKHVNKYLVDVITAKCSPQNPYIFSASGSAASVDGPAW